MPRRTSRDRIPTMEDIILNILAELRAGCTVDDRALTKLVNAQARADGADKSVYAKRRLLPYYQRVKQEEPERWASWDVDPELERKLLDVLRVKPRRSASGVATITVITKPWPCSNDCLYCPSDVRMPKSYLHAEPACERAEQNFFDPYLQVVSRLTALDQMGHATDKVELIILGGTWTDYPEPYRIWFVSELFRALNEGATVEAGEGGGAEGEATEEGVADTAVDEEGAVEEDATGERAVDEGAAGAGGEEPAGEETGGPDARPAAAGCAAMPADAVGRRAWYRACGMAAGGEELEAFAATAQGQVDAGACSYNRAIRELYGGSAAWRRASQAQTATWDELEQRQRENEGARHRAVGLVVETRPDAITAESLTSLRRLGCTKVQMGVQSLDQHVLDVNERGITVERIQEAFELLRAFGFKTHVHAMVNLLDATPETDRADYRRLVSEPAFQPDEVKLYPCALIGSARLCRRYEAGEWRPYSEDELVDVLAADVLATPAWTRISRMIRDFSSGDIVAGNKKPNLRQMVEARLRKQGAGPDAADPALRVQEIRFREVATSEVEVDALRMGAVSYRTTNTDERFLQWVTPEGRIAGFLRLSLPDQAYVRAHSSELPVGLGEAMIREVHVYGMATGLGEEGHAAQHLGLGRRLVERACELAREAGYARINVISAVGTRGYYRGLGFTDNGLYQQKEL